MTEDQQEIPDNSTAEIIANICNLGFEFRGSHEQHMAFSDSSDNHSPSRVVALSPDYADSIDISLRQDGVSPKRLEAKYGYTTQTGVFEIELGGALARPTFIYNRQLRTLLLDSGSECNEHPTGLFFRKTHKEEALAPLHVTNADSSICVELSEASPLGMLFSRGLLGPPRGATRSVLTLKVSAPGLTTHSEIEKVGTSVADAFLYELSVRNGVAFQPRYRRLGTPIKRPEYRTDAPVRFPSTRIEPEIAHLFQSAVSDQANPLTSFLYFYQILEFYFPYAVRKNAIRRVRAELNDPMFMNQDSDLLRIVSIAESSARNSESDQIATLIEDWVRSEKLAEYFAQPELGRYFGSSGPIKGVGEINHKSEKSGTLASQVSNRIYKLRNRIVHAKDDPKYADTKVLLSSSREAQFMGPDVDLAKLLAQEVIITAQMQA